MSKKNEEDGMRDTFFSDDPSPAEWDKTDGAANRRVSHAIRPRRRAVTAPTAPLPRTRLKPEVEPEMIDLVDLSKPPEAFDSFGAPALPSVQASAPAALPTTDWEALPLIDASGTRSRHAPSIPVADLDRDTTSVRAFDLLRTRLRQTCHENGWVNIGIASPTSGCGNTFTAVNLALSLSRVAASRTILMDFNMRNPALADAFAIEAPGEMKDFLLGEVAAEDHLVRISETLALGLNGKADPNSSETLQDRTSWETLAQMRADLSPELVLYDLPPMLVNDDVSAFLPQLDGVLLISDGTRTMAKHLLECERMLEGQVPLLGVVLNRARKSSIPRYR
ncbi:MAG: CpsD/CapB family tyrosine-protein kinase [Sulfitobacter sp.]|nr:CpsD/CapB family tyrosine-protein kinase [Sulfitobacter sp.]